MTHDELLEALGAMIKDDAVPVRCSPVLMEARKRLKAVGSYLIWSNEHSAWWRANSCGYTTHVEGAGIYTREEALSICKAARHGWARGEPPPEIPVRRDDVLVCTNEEVVRG